MSESGSGNTHPGEVQPSRCDDHLVAVVYQVHLFRTQLRHNAPLYHLRPPQESGQEVEVFHLQSWHRALVKKRVHGRTEDYHVVDYEEQELTVPGSCITRCLPANTEVCCDESPSLAHMGNPRMKTSFPARFASDCASLHLPHTPDFAAPTQPTFAVETTPKNDTGCGTFWELVYTRASDKVMVYGGPAVGWQRGVVQGVAEGTSWCPTGSAESPFHLVSRATERDEEAVDFGFVPDSRVFTVNMSGAIERVPAHVLFNTGGDEPAAPATQLAQRLHVGVPNFFNSFVSSEP